MVGVRVEIALNRKIDWNIDKIRLIAFMTRVGVWVEGTALKSCRSISWARPCYRKNVGQVYLLLQIPDIRITGNDASSWDRERDECDKFSIFTFS